MLSAEERLRPLAGRHREEAPRAAGHPAGPLSIPCGGAAYGKHLVGGRSIRGSLPIDEPSSLPSGPIEADTSDPWSVTFDDFDLAPSDPWAPPSQAAPVGRTHVELPDLPPLPPLPPLSGQTVNDAKTANESMPSFEPAGYPPKTHPLPGFFIDPFAPLREACGEQPLDWEKIDCLAREAAESQHPMPGDLIDKVDESSQRMQARTLLQQAIHQGKGPKSVVAVYQPALLDDWPICAPLVQQAKEALALAAVLDQLEALVRNPNDGRETLVRLWARHRSPAERSGGRGGGEVVGREVGPPGAGVRDLAGHFEAPLEASARDRRRLGPGGARRASILTQRFHRLAGPTRPKHGWTAWMLSRSIPEDGDESNDVQWQQTWKDDLLRNCSEADPLRQRSSAVSERLLVLADLRQAIENADAGTGPEQVVVATADRLPQGYRHQAHLRVVTAQGADRRPSGGCYKPSRHSRPRIEPSPKPGRDSTPWSAAGSKTPSARSLPSFPSSVATASTGWQKSPMTATKNTTCNGSRRGKRTSWATARKPSRCVSGTRPSGSGCGCWRICSRQSGEADQGTGTEQTVVAAAARLPQGYRYQSQPRVQTARLRLADNRALSQALQAQPQSDRAIARAFEKLDPVERSRLDATLTQRCQLAVKRRDCLDALAAISTSRPEDEQDAEWLVKWKESLLQDCPDADPFRDRYRLAQERVAAWRALEKCLKEADLKNTSVLAAHPLLVDYPPVLLQRAFIEQRLAQQEKLERLHQLLDKHFEGLRKDDLDFLRDFPRIVAPERPRIESELFDWLNREANQLKPGSPPFIVDPQSGQVRVKWTWPSFDLIGKCWLAVHEKKLQRPEEVGGLISQFDPDSHRGHQRSGGVPIAPLMPAGARSVWVAVWPIIDIGWLRVVGDPLHLGPVNSASGARPAAVATRVAAPGAANEETEAQKEKHP